MPADVVLAHLHSAEVASSFHHSLLQLVSHDRGRDPDLWRLAGWQSMSCGSGGLVEARNMVAAEFLAGDSEWLLSIDSDMGFSPDALDRLLEVADPQTCPIVGGLCFAQKEVGGDGAGGFRCEPRVTIFDWVKPAEDLPATFTGRRHYPVNTVVQCAGTGMAFLLIHRSILQRIQAEHGDTWFTRVPGSDGKLLGEDISFCLRAGTLGAPIHVHTGVKVTHLKNTWVGEPDYWSWMVPEPAVEDTAVVVPVMGRPEHAEPFMRSLRASTGLAIAYAVTHDGDDPQVAKAWDHAGAHIIEVPDDEISFACKVNVGYRATTEPWLFIAGSDVRFRPGWLDHAQEVAHRYQAHVVGTNDLGNPAVLAGEHATHMLISRSYIDTVGASWDGPGVACHEGYRHWYVDNELVTAAKQRGVWQMAFGSIVEHLHPAWGKAPMDDVYKLGQGAASKDRLRWEQRVRKHAS